MKRQTPLYDGGLITAEVLDFASSVVRAGRTDGARSEAEPPDGWIVRNLLKYGQVAYIPDGSPLSGWYLAQSGGVLDRYARPEWLNLRTQATASAVFPYEGAKLVRANLTGRPPILTIERYARMIAQCDTAIAANIYAAMRSQILGVPDKRKLDAEILLDNAAAGLPTILDTDALASITTLDVAVPFDAREKHALRQTLYSELLKHFGGITPTEYKAERVQSAEVSAHVAEAIDNVYVLIDQANADMTAQGVPYRLEYVGVGKTLDPTEGGAGDGE